MNVLGIDIGSSSTKAVLLDDSLRLLSHWEIKNRGNPAGAFQSLISEILENEAGELFRIGVTGAGREIVQAPEEVFFANEIVSLSIGAARFYPGTRSVIEIGAQSSRWILLDGDKRTSDEPGILDFALNDVCAAGSGAFLEQQAVRLKLGMEEFAGLAAAADKGAAVAGRCSVFAKTDMIHLQQKGTPVEEIAFGLCLALARNFASTVLKGREVIPPVLLAGGGVRNRGLVNAFRKILDLGDGQQLTAEPPQLLGALGAAAGARQGDREVRIPATKNVFKILNPQRSHKGLQALPLKNLDRSRTEEPAPGKDEFVTGYLGVDLGSVSTNLVLVDAAGEVRAGVYLPTKGRPLEVLRDGYRELKEKCPGGFKILGIGTTGSGRHLAGALFQADAVHNEITCQLRSTSRFFPEADTIFEIGGQDSKFISACGGRLRDFAMNKICAAGTGSFLEEQSEILGIKIEEEFSGLAEESAAPADLGSRCTVFMESELTDALGRGVPVSDIAAGLAYSIARNYLEKVVAGRPIGRTVVFQGGVASNPAVVKALALESGREILVHPYNRISGAIGAALMAKEKVEKSGRKSLDAASVARRLGQEFSVKGFTCSHCSNRCQVNKIMFEDKTVFFGDTCERYTTGRGELAQPEAVSETGDRRGLPDLFEEREKLAKKFIANPPGAHLRIGLPKASILREYLPFWTTFFNSLDAEVVVSPDSNPEILEIGLKKLPAETCLPIKIAFGHIEWFKDSGVDRIFFPSVIDHHRNPAQSVSFCPYSEHFPFMAKAATEAQILTPSIDMSGTAGDFLKSLGEELKVLLGKSEGEILEAYEKASAAQEAFTETLLQRGREILDSEPRWGGPIWAVIGRPYTLYDAFLTLNLGRHMRKLGILAVPISFLPFERNEGVEWPGTPHWRYNREAVQAALWCSRRPWIRPVILTNFGCGLDAFNMKHVSEIVSGIPHLVLEFDEHRAEAGLITRLEAFLDESAGNGIMDAVGPRLTRSRKPLQAEAPAAYRNRKFVIPYFADHVYAFSGAFRGVGIESAVLPLPDEETVALGEQHSTGKECHAYSIIAGDFVKFARSQRKGNEVFYFPGTKYTCVLNQYDKGMNYLAEDLGFSDLEAIAPSTDFLTQLLSMKGLRLLWQGMVAIDLLIRAACAVRPYERTKGRTDETHVSNLKDIEAGLTSGDIGPALKRCAERLRSIEVKKERRPVVGIAGDIYTRINPVANHGLFLKLEELGCEVRPSSFFVEEVDFNLGRSFRRKINSRKYRESTVVALLYLRKELEKKRIRKGLEQGLPLHKNPTFNDVVRSSSPYVGLDNNHVVLLNIAKMVEFAKMGADGVINAICFNCMLGTVSAAIAPKIRKDFDNIPIPTFIYTGSELASERTKLEAFVYQVKQSAGRRERKSHPKRSARGKTVRG